MFCNAPDANYNYIYNYNLKLNSSSAAFLTKKFRFMQLPCNFVENRCGNVEFSVENHVENF